MRAALLALLAAPACAGPTSPEVPAAAPVAAPAPTVWELSEFHVPATLPQGVSSHGQPSAECKQAVTALLDGLGTCRRMAPPASGPTEAVFDGDPCSWWNANAHPPQAVTLALPHGPDLSAVLLIPEMTPPSGPVEHVLEISDDGGHYHVAARISGVMTARHAYLVVLPSPLHAHHARLTTTRSSSWVAWFEVMPLACEAAPIVPAGAVQIAGAE